MVERRSEKKALAMWRADPAVSRVMLHVIWGSADTNQAHGSHGIVSCLDEGGVYARAVLVYPQKPVVADLYAIKGVREGQGLKTRDPAWTAQQVFDHSRRNAQSIGYFELIL